MMNSSLSIVMKLGPIVFLGALIVLPFLYAHYRSAPLPKKSLSVVQYVFVIFVFGVLAFLAGIFAGMTMACEQKSAGNLCGLVGFLGTGPLFSGIAMLLVATIITRRARISPN